MNKCMDCNHWSPKHTDVGMSRLGFAVCLKRPTPGRTMSAHSRECERFSQAEATITEARHAKWDKKLAAEERGNLRH